MMEKLFAATKTDWQCSSVCVARLVAMRVRDLAQAEQLIAECKNRIARQREVIANAFHRPRHRGSYINAPSFRGKPSSLREAPSTRPCSAKKSGAAMTGENRIGATMNQERAFCGLPSS
jgi:hypothetical protein